MTRWQWFAIAVVLGLGWLFLRANHRAEARAYQPPGQASDSAFQPSSGGFEPGEAQGAASAAQPAGAAGGSGGGQQTTTRARAGGFGRGTAQGAAAAGQPQREGMYGGMMGGRGGYGMGMMMGGAQDPAMAAVQEDAGLEQRTHELIRQYAATRDEGERANLRQELEKVVNQHFDLRQERRDQEIRQLEERVQELRRLLQRRSESKPQIINDRLSQLLREADGLGWGDAPAASGTARTLFSGGGRGSASPSAVSTTRPGTTTTTETPRFAAPSSGAPK